MAILKPPWSPTVKFLSWKQRVEERGTSISTEKRQYAADPRYPRLVQISPGRKAFVADELDQYDALIIAERDQREVHAK